MKLTFKDELRFGSDQIPQRWIVQLAHVEDVRKALDGYAVFNGVPVEDVRITVSGWITVGDGEAVAVVNEPVIRLLTHAFKTKHGDGRKFRPLSEATFKFSVVEK